MNQATNVNIVPSYGQRGDLHFSQYDVGRTATINLYAVNEAYTIPVGATVKIQATKPSGLGFDVACTFSGSVVTVVSTETMTAEAGRFPCELRITKDSDVIGTANFMFVVEASPHPDGVIDGDADEVINEIAALVLEAEGYALGTQNGVPVTSESDYYHNNAKWYAEHPVGGGVSDDIKQALLNCFQNVAWIGDDGQDYYDALQSALYPPAELVSISAVYTQSGTVYTTDSLDSLKAGLVVTATYSDSSSATVPSANYTLSGTLAEGTQTITVSYGGKTDTFVVNCTVNGWLYHFEQNLDSSGSKDFGFSGSVAYDTGHDGTGYSFYNNPECISASGYTAPSLTGDFTISFWAKTLVEKNGQGFSPYEFRSTTNNIPQLASAQNIKSGWSVTNSGVKNVYGGIRLGSWGTGGKNSSRIYNADITKGTNFEAEPPSGFVSNDWHHYAWTRKNSTFMFFVDGSRIFTANISDTLSFATQCAFGGWYDGASPSTPSSNKSWYDDLFVAEYCKWDSNFDPSTITY